MITTRQFKASDGLVLSCVDYGGEGLPPMLLVHGGAAHARWWDFVGPAFTDRYHVLALDQRGHGESPWTKEWTYGTRQYVADLVAVIDGWDLGRPVLVGHSMGGHTVMAYTVDHSEKLRAMIVIDSPASYPQEAVEALRKIGEKPSRPYETLEDAIANFRTNPPQNMAKPEILQYVARLSFRRDEQGKWGHKMDRRTLIREPISVTKSLSRITCPALYIRAGSSVMALGVTQKIAASIPECRHTHVPDSFHHVMIDNPTGLIGVMNEFLNQLS
ncbi:MAG TPA: alpha/beta hydrolase [Candidatus Binataceae bacterium]|nr:alpha/beta hydrolase [Candidatus Binataceae bacterium]